MNGKNKSMHSHSILVRQQHKSACGLTPFSTVIFPAAASSKSTSFLFSSNLILRRFPFYLQYMLAEAERTEKEHIISWLPCGTMFKVHNKEKFEKEILPRFCRHKKHKSFLRQLSMYKFKRITEGPNRGAYQHPYFVRNRLDLCELIQRGKKSSTLLTFHTIQLLELPRLLVAVILMISAILSRRISSSRQMDVFRSTREAQKITISRESLLARS